MSEAQIKHMVDRFLSWRLPANFNPDGGISFTPSINQSTGKPYEDTPTGTNLLDATQADAMVRHTLGGLPATSEPPPSQPDERTSLKLFTCTGFAGFYPVGTSAIVLAENEAQARSLLREELDKIKLPQTEPLEISELELNAPFALILNDGDY